MNRKRIPLRSNQLQCHKALCFIRRQTSLLVNNALEIPKPICLDVPIIDTSANDQPGLRIIQQNIFDLPKASNQLNLMLNCCYFDKWQRSYDILCKLRSLITDMNFQSVLCQYLSKLSEKMQENNECQQIYREIEKNFDPIHGQWKSIMTLPIMTRLCCCALYLYPKATDQSKVASAIDSLLSAYPQYTKLQIAQQYTNLTRQEIKQLSQLFEIDNNQVLSDKDIPLENDLETNTSQLTNIQKHSLHIESSQTKSIGLSLLKKSLSRLIYPSNVDLNQLSEVEKEHYNINRQRLLEASAIDNAIAEWQHMMQNKGGNPVSNKINSILWHWHKKLRKSLEAYQNNLKTITNREAGFLTYAVFLSLINAERLSAITIMALTTNLKTEGKPEMSANFLYAMIGNSVEKEYQAQMLRDSDWQRTVGFKTSFDRICHNPRLFAYALKKLREKKPDTSTSEILKQMDLDVSQNCQAFLMDWSHKTKLRIGYDLLNLAVSQLTIPQPITNLESKKQASAFHTSYSSHKGKVIAVVSVHEDIMALLKEKPPLHSLQLNSLPMLVQPKPWTQHKNGGFLYTPTTIMRTKQSKEQKMYLNLADETGQLKSLYKALNCLGNVPWTLNERIFNYILQIYNSGKKFPGIPPKTLDFQEHLETTLAMIAKNGGKLWNSEQLHDLLKSLGKKSVYELKQEIRDNVSQRCDLNYKIEVARAFLGEKFYLPHNIDFRGRAYPLSNHLHHLGSDLARSLLRFYEEKELGERGLYWLKVHLAGLCGFDKKTFKEREQWTEENRTLIIMTADNPFNPAIESWWSQFEDCWQVLAACIELDSAWKLEDPTKFKSGFPVHQDGTCNGLQHYAALGCDSEGAAKVNLSASESPQDVYKAVSEAVSELVASDAENAKSPNNALAKLLVNKISRSVVKQTVMTNVYGVTFVGARAQIETQLKKIITDTSKVYSCSIYIAALTFKSLNKMFNRASQIQLWLMNAASQISKAYDPKDKTRTEKMASVIWTTPLNIPIVQPYRTEKYSRIRTKLQTITFSDPDVINTVSSSKQTAAFPPNFIHSLDATHMLMTALACDRAKITFAAIHDSYWTHACDVDIMKECLRSSFVELHSRDIMGHLKKEFEERYKDLVTPITTKLKTLEDFEKIGHVRSIKIADTKSSCEAVSSTKISASITKKIEDLMADGGKPINQAECSTEINAKTTEKAEYITRDGGKPTSQAERSLKIQAECTGHIEIITTDKPLSQAERNCSGGNNPIDFVKVPEKGELDIKFEAEASTEKKKVIKYKPIDFGELPEKGDFDIQEILRSEYFFS